VNHRSSDEAQPGRDASSPDVAPHTPSPELRQYDDNGVDLSLIRANMRLTFEERARRAEHQRRAALRVQQLGRSLRTKPA
jgi:hypothetical protein